MYRIVSVLALVFALSYEIDDEITHRASVRAAESGPTAPAVLTVTDRVVARGFEPIWANLTSIAGGTSFAINTASRYWRRLNSQVTENLFCGLVVLQVWVRMPHP
jgi:hypothetical protein